MTDTFQSHGTFRVGGKTCRIARLSALAEHFDLGKLPYSIKILLENLLRREDGSVVTALDVEAVAGWEPNSGVEREIQFMPGRVLMQDFTGVPAVVDLAALRDAMRAMGGDPRKINPLIPAELVIDHLVQVDWFASKDALARNTELEFERNRERYLFLRWGQSAFENFKVVPPGTGICHQVNLEYLARVVMISGGKQSWAHPDTVVGTDSHTTMINGLGVLGWGVGGIEAEAAMLGQPVSMLIPEVVGFRLKGRLATGATATDLVLTATEMLRAHGVVGKFVEFFGEGLASLSLADRATIANMAPEYGATCGIFPVDAETLEYLRFSGRSEEQVALVEAYTKEQGLFYDGRTAAAQYSSVLELDLGKVEPSLAGPKRPQDRLSLSAVKGNFEQTLESESKVKGERGATATRTATLEHGAVVIAAITSCTNTSNPSVMVAAGLVAKKANALGLRVKPWVKTSLAPGSKVVTEYLTRSGLLAELEKQGFHVVGYGCTTCIGNSGPLPKEVQGAIDRENLLVAAVLSGNRNFEGRVHAAVRANYLASPPLVVAYALAGRVDFDPRSEPLGTSSSGKPVYLRDVWPSEEEIRSTVRASLTAEQFRRQYADVFQGPEAWRKLPVPTGDVYAWDARSTYVRSPPYFVDLPREPKAVTDIRGARVLALVGDSITTDHISPAGEIKAKSPAGQYLLAQGVAEADFNSLGARRGNHEVMMRATFANVRFKNELTPGIEGSSAVHFPDGAKTTIHDAALKYLEEGVATIVLAGKEYGTGSSRDWAAKGPALLGVRAVIARSFERIHRSNLIGMGILPLEFPAGESAATLGLDGRETYAIAAAGFAGKFQPGRTARVRAVRADGKAIEFDAKVRIDTPNEHEYWKHGGILPFVLRKLLQ